MFPLSNWTELDVWQYIHVEKIPIVPMYFAKEREMLVRGDSLIPLEQPFIPMLPRREAADGSLPDAVARVQPVHGCDPIGRRYGAEDHRRVDLVPAV